MDKSKIQSFAQIFAAVSALVLLITAGTIMFHRLENWTWIQSFYFTVSTLTTVGYGDLHPTSDTTRLFTAIFILAGAGIALAALGTIGSKYINRRASQIVKENDK